MSRAPEPTWSGRLPGGVAPEAWTFMHSLPIDSFLAECDVVGSIGHVQALEDAGVLTKRDAARLVRALDRLEWRAEPSDEDVHSATERQLTEQLGDLGARVHTGRSRNDQVATDLRLWARGAALDLTAATLGLMGVLADRADEHASTLCPGYTHLQRAQPVTVGHWLCAHAFALERDVARFVAAHDAADVSALGAGALAGNTLGIRPEVSARALGFSRTFDNTIDAVSDRDFVLDLLYACAVAATHLSRLAEEMVLWASSEFGFVRLPDAWATGSSMMPQKKNPDVAELARAQAGAGVGALTALLVTLKGLPLAYDRDLQADKRGLPDVAAGTALALRAMTGLVRDVSFDPDRLRAACADEGLLATDLAEALVARRVPFRHAHERVAALVRSAEAAGTSLSEALGNDAAALAPVPVDEALRMLDPRASVARRTTPGGPSLPSVRAQVRALRRTVARGRTRIASLDERLPARPKGRGGAARGS